MGSISAGQSLGSAPLSSLAQQKMVVTVDGSPLKGHVNELKDGVSIEQAMAAGKSDGVDQVFVESNGKNYVIQGESLDLKGIKKGETFAQLYIGDTPVRASIKGIDNESNTMKEGAWNLGTKIGLGGVAASITLGIVGSALEHGPDAGGAAMAGMMFSLISAGVAGISAVGGATVGAIKGSDMGLKDLIKQ